MDNSIKIRADCINCHKLRHTSQLLHWYNEARRKIFNFNHHQPINVPTAGAQAFFMDYTQEEWAITHHAGPVRVG
jgi:hypothetical protein